jgi:hypothetical protein
VQKFHSKSPSTSGGNLGVAGASAPYPPPPPHLRVKWRIFGNFDLYKRAKNSLFECKWGGGGCRKFESFVGNLEGFAPPPPEKVNFRHWNQTME